LLTIPKTLEITVSDEFYEALKRRSGQSDAGAYLEEIAGLYVTGPQRDDPEWEAWLEKQYREQAAEEAALGDALYDDEWARLGAILFPN
jgi:hypothetical protein